MKNLLEEPKRAGVKKCRLVDCFKNFVLRARKACQSQTKFVQNVPRKSLMLFIWFQFAASYLVRVPLFNARQLALATSAIARLRNPRLSAFAKRACTVEQKGTISCV